MSDYFIRGGRSYFKFKTGVEVQINSISPLLPQELGKKHPQPKVPVIKVPTADGSGFYDEETPSNRAYQSALQEWNQLIEEKSRILLIKQGVILDLTPSQIAEVEKLRRFMRDTFEIELDPDDKFCYVSFILIQSEKEYGDLANAVMSRSMPTEEAIANAIEATFQSDLQKA